MPKKKEYGCFTCGIPLQEESYKHKGKRYCDLCEVPIREVAEMYKKLIEYICESFGVSEPSGQILKQIKRYKDDYGWSYRDIGYTLWYIDNMTTYSPDIKYGIGLVKTFYDEAMEHCAENKPEITTSTDGVDLYASNIKVIPMNNVEPPKQEDTLSNHGLIDLCDFICN